MGSGLLRTGTRRLCPASTPASDRVQGGLLSALLVEVRVRVSLAVLVSDVVVEILGDNCDSSPVTCILLQPRVAIVGLETRNYHHARLDRV